MPSVSNIERTLIEIDQESSRATQPDLLNSPPSPLENDAALEEMIAGLLSRRNNSIDDLRRGLSKFSPYRLKSLLKVSEGELASVFRGAILADRACKVRSWQSNSAYILRILEHRLASDAYEQLVDWALRHRGRNPYLPFGRPTGARNLEEWRSEEQRRRDQMRPDQVRLRAERAADNLSRMRLLCTRNGRICPKPAQWAELWNRLPSRGRVHAGEQALEGPLILGSWHHSSDEEKKERLDEHLQWACRRNVGDRILEFLDSLSDEQWHHLDA